MNVDEIRRLFSYTEWANGRMIECARGLSEEQFTRAIPSSFPTIRDTLAHIVMGEQIWLRRWKGESLSVRPAWIQEPSLDLIEMHFRGVAEERAHFLMTVTDEDLQRDLEYRTFAGAPFANRLGDLMMHVVNHGTYHRGQLTTMIRQVGATPPATDFVNIFLLGHK